MAESSLGPTHVPAGSDGWAVINLEEAAIVRANPAGLTLLDLDTTALPVSLATLLTVTDLTLTTERVLPHLRQGNVWNGALRLSGSRTDTAPLTITVVPHMPVVETQTPSHATMFFTVRAATRAAVLVPDPLTGLPTRSALFDRLDRALRDARQTGTMIATLFVDLDGLKKINDRYGHEVGDTTLIETSQRIAACLPAGDIAARFGGDEFVVLCVSFSDPEQAVDLAERILHALRGIDDYQAISSSIGISTSPRGEVDALELIRRADLAMYRAKARGGAQAALFDSEMHDRQQADQALRTNLLDAISNNGFSVAAQPLFELATGRIIGVELFIRLRDDTPYVANANDLFRLAHEHGEEIDAAILGRAIALAHRWQESLGRAAPRLHVNVSAQSLVAANFVRRVQNALAGHRVRASAIAFEIDSRDLAPAGDRERATIAGLQDLGLPVVIDGYGGDALALRQLAEWRPTMVKIETADTSTAVLTGLIRGVSSLAVATCLKGMGSQTQVDTAVAIGAYSGQGNALTPVRSVARINRQLHDNPRLGF